MKITIHLLLLLAAVASGLAVGFGFRSKRGVDLPAPAVAAAAFRATSGPPTNGIRLANHLTTVRLNDDSPLATQLEKDLSMSTGVTRWLCWVDALERAADSDFPRLFRLAQGNAAARRLVVGRWVEVAPRQLYDLIVSGRASAQGLPVEELADVLFNEWPKRDPEAAIAALDGSKSSGISSHWRFTVAYGLIDTDVERALHLMVNWHSDDVGFGPRGIAAITKWFQANPQHAGEFMLQLSDSYSMRSAIEVVGQEWAKTDPAGALALATSKSGELASQLATHTLKNWAERNLGDAANWLSAADDGTRSRLSPVFVEAWAKRDASTALAWCEENLTGSTLAQSVAGVLRGAAENDAAGAASLVDQMSPGATRTEAAVAVAQKLFPSLSADQTVTSETVAWLGRLDSDSVRRVMEKITWGWATSDPRSMAAFLAESPADQIPAHSYSVAARELARRNPVEALDWANRLSGESALSAGGAAFVEWRSAQPDAARQWWNDLPETDNRRQPYLESAMRALAYHAQAVDQLAELSPAESAIARDVIAKMELPEPRRTRLLDVLKTH